MGGLVQPPPAARAHRKRTAGRSRSALLRSEGGACPSRVIQAKTPPRNPARFTLALGALLRGPAVGLTDEELLDLVGELPPDPEKPDALPPLRLFLDLASVAHPLARLVLERLQALAKRANSTTPHDLLSQAVDALHLRPILQQRHHGHAERALANVDLFLDLARPYAVRGLGAFAEAMMEAWEGQTRALEGRPDAQEESVALYTMHAAKGLEWPVVILINTTTEVPERSGEIIDRAANCLYCPVFGVD